MYKFYISRNVIFNYSKILFKVTTTQKLLNRHCSVRRALLHVPGNIEEKLSNALQLEVDCIVLNCNRVPQDKKIEARENIKAFLDKAPVSESDPEWSVQINPVQTLELCEDDINTILSATHLPRSICLPKVNNVDQLQWFAEKVWNALLKRPEDDRGPIKLLMVVESAIAVLNLPELCKKAFELSTMAPIIPVGLIFDDESLRINIGGKKTPSSIELLYARQKTVLVAKAFGLQAIDTIFFNHENQVGLLESCKDGAILGFTGKQIVHPDQIIVTQNVFTPTVSRIRWAKFIMRNTAKQENDEGALNSENAMADISTIKEAENVLKAAKAAGKLQE